MIKPLISLIPLISSTINDRLRPFNIIETITGTANLQTSSGPILGVTRQVLQDFHAAKFPTGLEKFHIESYYHVPYGKAGRLEYAQAPDTWEKPLDCKKLDHSTHCFNKDQSHYQGQEDCLKLMIHRPINSTEALPVLFWIHGGSFSAGTAEGFNVLHSDNTLYDPVALVHTQNIIVVSIDYRLNLFGAFDLMDMYENSDQAIAKGNYFLSDLVQAVQYTLQNAEYWNIDREKTGVAGQSAGGILANILPSLPGMKGLIKRQFLHSGNNAMFLANHLYWNNSNGPSAREAASFGHCNFPEPEDIYDCVMNLPKEDIGHTISHTNITWRPSVDGRFLKSTPIEQFIERCVDVDLFVGSTSGDGFTFALPYLTKGIEPALRDLLDEVSYEPQNDQYLIKVGAHWFKDWNPARETRLEAEQFGLIYSLSGINFHSTSLKIAMEHDKVKNDGVNTYWANFLN